ncbi:MAG: hypothetical protein AAB728_05085 [Patescibacteria group bacterium]
MPNTPDQHLHGQPSQPEQETVRVSPLNPDAFAELLKLRASTRARFSGVDEQLTDEEATQ